MGKKLTRAFYARDTLTVAQELLGKKLVRDHADGQISGYITEVEAYIGETDQASHARPGPTARNAPMYGPAGHAYVYLIYGMYHCLNFVTERVGFPAALLIRALEPLEGITTMRRLRGPQHPPKNLARGPGRLCQALAIDRSFNNLDTCTPNSTLWIEERPNATATASSCSPRIGVRGDEIARQIHWRYYIKGSQWVSGKQTFNRQHEK